VLTVSEGISTFSTLTSLVLLASKTSIKHRCQLTLQSFGANCILKITSYPGNHWTSYTETLKKNYCLHFINKHDTIVSN
jgi:hypothetical protein